MKHWFSSQKKTPFLIILSVLFCSCFGVKADITLNQNGSGSLTLEYHISKSLDSLGKFDGNERWNTIPVGKADFERTIDRLPDMKLISFSSKENNKDLVITVKMEFLNIESLLSFLDAQGHRSDFSGDAGSGRLVLILNDGKNINKGTSLDKLLVDITKPYSVSVSMTVPVSGSLKVLNGAGQTMTPVRGSVIQDKGKKIFCSFPLYEVLTTDNGLKVEFEWSSGR